MTKVQSNSAVSRKRSKH